MGFWNQLASAAVPSLVNGVSQIFTNKSNQNNYNAAQDRANAFARSERIATQNYNSLENQFGQMARVGMNPNLLTGQSFVASSPVPNQSVSPPLNTAPAMPAETLTQAALNSASAENQRETAITTRDLRAGQIKQQNAELNFTVANTENAKAQLPSIQKQVDVIETTLADMRQRVIESDARTQNVREDTAKMRELRGTWRRQAEKQIDEIISRISVNAAQRSQLMANREHILALAEGVKFQNKLNEDTRSTLVDLRLGERKEQKVRITAGMLNNSFTRFQLGNYKNYGELEKILGVTSSALQVANQLLDLTPAERIKKDLKDFLPFSNNSPSTEPLQTPYGSGGFSSSWSQ